MNHNPPDCRPLDDIDVRIAETESGHATELRIEVATFTEGEHVESMLISRDRAAEIYRDLGRILGVERTKSLGVNKTTDDREVPICPHCGSANVAADAAARWNVDSQAWEVSNVFDKGHGCDDCEAVDMTFDWITEKEHADRAAAKAGLSTENP